MVPNAANILLRNVYGWFTRIERGVYQLTSKGDAALARWSNPDTAGHVKEELHPQQSNVADRELGAATDITVVKGVAVLELHRVVATLLHLRY